MIFTPVVDFHSEEFRSDYCVGLRYTVTPGNQKLMDCVKTWLESGNIRIVDAPVHAPHPATLSGTGKVG